MTDEKDTDIERNLEKIGKDVEKLSAEYATLGEQMFKDGTYKPGTFEKMDRIHETVRRKTEVPRRVDSWLASGCNNNPNDFRERQMDVMKLLHEGRSTKQIASKLGISERTTKQHLGSIYARLPPEYAPNMGGAILYFERNFYKPE